MSLPFNVRKAAQVAAFFTKAEGGRISVLKLIKLIYLSDRKFMEKYDCPILDDYFVSMDHGPVNSITLDYIDGCREDRENWDTFVSDREEHTVALSRADLTDRDLDQLSKAELDTLAEIWRQFGPLNKWQLRDHTHTLPEWENPHGSSSPIPAARIFRHLGKANGDELERDMARERAVGELLA